MENTFLATPFLSHFTRLVEGSLNVAHAQFVSQSLWFHLIILTFYFIIMTWFGNVSFLFLVEMGFHGFSGKDVFVFVICPNFAGFFRLYSCTLKS